MRFLFRGLLFGIMSMLAVIAATVWPSAASAEPIVQTFHLPSNDAHAIIVLAVAPIVVRSDHADGEDHALKRHAATGPIAPDYDLSERSNGQNFLRPHMLC